MNGLPAWSWRLLPRAGGKGHRKRLKPSARIDDFRSLRHDRDDQFDLVTIAVTVRGSKPRRRTRRAPASLLKTQRLNTTQKDNNERTLTMNSSSNLLVLGVTGQVGKLVAGNLKRCGAHFSVGTRRKANLEELADQFGASRFIDLDDPRTFDEALKHVTGLFLITGYTVDMLVQSKTLIDAAKRNGVNHIVHLGVFTRERDTYTTVFAWHQMIEAYLRDSGVAWTNLHRNMFMQNL